MKLLPLSKNGPTTTTRRPTTLMRSSSWPWKAYCHQPKTLSFRGGDDLFRSMNSAYLEPPEEEEEEEEEEGYEGGNNDDSIETVIRGARSECRGRLFFEPAGETSSVLVVESDDGASEEEQHARDEPVDDGVAVCVVESRNPYRDFRMSMEEMAEAHALRGNWDSLEELLRCYLRVNDRANHAYIYGAFVDLLLSSDRRRTRPTTDCSSCSCNSNKNVGSGGASSINPPSTSSPCSPLSFYTSSSSCCSSSNSLSTTPCCISTIGEAEDSSSSSGSVTVTIEQRQQRQPLSLKAAVEQDRPEGDESSSSSVASSSSDV